MDKLSLLYLILDLKLKTTNLTYINTGSRFSDVNQTEFNCQSHSRSSQPDVVSVEGDEDGHEHVEGYERAEGPPVGIVEYYGFNQNQKSGEPKNGVSCGTGIRVAKLKSIKQIFLTIETIFKLLTLNTRQKSESDYESS